MNDERIADATAVGLAFPAAEWRIAREGPTPGIVIEGAWTAEFVNLLEILLQRVWHVVEELVFIHRSVRAAFGTGAVVGDEQDEGVLPLADRFQEVEQAAIVIVGVGEEAGKDLHHARI